jgi:hypothetical protein
MNSKHNSIASRAGMRAQDIPNEALWNHSAWITLQTNLRKIARSEKNNYNKE